jgi:GTP cyclohydrolase FolE2
MNATLPAYTKGGWDDRLGVLLTTIDLTLDTLCPDARAVVDRAHWLATELEQKLGRPPTHNEVAAAAHAQRRKERVP